MRNNITKLVMTAASLLLAASLSFAAETKKPDAKPASDSAKTGAKATATSAKDSTKTTAADAKTAVKPSIIDINTATETELKAVPGIGEAYAAKIVAGRPYAKKDQLKSRNILPGPVYEKVKEQLIAKQPAKEAPAKPTAKEAPAKKK